MKLFKIVKSFASLLVAFSILGANAAMGIEEKVYKCENPYYPDNLPTENWRTEQKNYFVHIEKDSSMTIYISYHPPFAPLAQHRRISGVPSIFTNTGSYQTYLLNYAIYDEDLDSFSSSLAKFHINNFLSPYPNGEHKIFAKLQIRPNAPLLDCERIAKTGLFK